MKNPRSRWLFLFLFLFGSYSVYSQQADPDPNPDTTKVETRSEPRETEPDKKYYTPIVTNPDQIDIFWGSAGVGFAAMPKALIGGWMIDVNTVFDRARVNANVIAPFFSGFYDGNVEDAMLNYDDQFAALSIDIFKAMLLDLTGTYYFISKSKDAPIDVTLDQKSKGNVTVRLYDVITIPKQRRWGARFGYIQDRYSFPIGNLVDGGVVGFLNGATEIGVSSISNSHIAIGLDMTSIYNFVYSTEHFGKRYAAKVLNYYADLIVSASANSSLYRMVGDIPVLYNGTASPEFSNIGFRIGVGYMDKSYKVRNSGIRFQIEAGMRPFPIVEELAFDSQIVPIYLKVNLGWFISSGTSSR